ncbi:MAG: sulfurtransferase TusC [Rhodospirillaceae bacterium]|jgi:tRNA 2-thiouridine synthesizing protein C|nr:sulfurtransferase TusC [Rhodospirillaceae bacterium]
MEDVEFDTEGVKRKFMFVNSKAPYGTIYALEVLEMIMISAAFEQHAVIAFIDDGVFQIKKGHNTKATGMKNFSPTYGVVEMEKEDADEDDDIDMVWRIVVEKESIEARGLSADDFVVDVEVLSSAELSDLMAEQEVVLSG